MSWKVIVGVLIVIVGGFVGYSMLQNRSDAGDLVASTAATATQTAAVNLAEVIKKRQALMKEQGGHMKAINEFVESGTGTAEDVAKHAEALKASSTQVVDLFPAGTSLDDDVGKASKTAAKPDIWAKLDEFKLAAAKLGEEAGKLAEAAATGDKGKIGEQFAMLGKNGCGGCHSTFRQKLD